MTKLSKPSQAHASTDTAPVPRHAGADSNIELIPLIDTSYKSLPTKPIPGTNYSELDDLPPDIWKRIINEHLEDVTLAESCALFGGFGIRIDHEYWLLPQCCCTLADIENWQRLTDPAHYSDRQTIIMSEGHPGPIVRVNDGTVHFDCDDPNEPFHPRTMPSFSIDPPPFAQRSRGPSSRLRPWNEPSTRLRRLLAPARSGS